MRRLLILLPWILVTFMGAYVLKTQHLLPYLRSSSQTPVPSQITMPPNAPERTLTINGNGQGVYSYHDAVKVAAPAVVNIYTTEKVEAHSQLDDPFLRRFFEYHGIDPNEGQQGHNAQPTSLGSGVIVRPDGYILTNNHVVEKADKITVGLQDGRRATAKVVGTDPDSDLAVIKVELSGLPVVPFKQSANQVGDVVLAIGNPFGVGQTVTQGIISATERSGLGINAFEDFIQTDAAINPGNSGGALIDVAGNLIGINTAIFSRSGGSMGIGFAIPSSLAQQVMSSIIQTGKVTRGWLGVEVAGQQDPSQLNPEEGAKIMGVVRNGPADQGGMRVGDVVVSVAGHPIHTAAQLIQLVARQQPGIRLPLEVKRGNEIIKLQVPLAERPKSPARTETQDEELPFGQ